MFDQDLLDQKNKELLDHANNTEPVDFYEEGEYYEEDETAEVEGSDSDSDYEPPTFISARDAAMLFTG